MGKDPTRPGRPKNSPNITTGAHIKAQDRAVVELGREVLRLKHKEEGASDEDCMVAWYKAIDTKDLVQLVGRRMPKQTTLDLGDKQTWAMLVTNARSPELPLTSIPAPVSTASKALLPLMGTTAGKNLEI